MTEQEKRESAAQQKAELDELAQLSESSPHLVSPAYSCLLTPSVAGLVRYRWTNVKR